MIQMESLVQVADNTGARSAKMIGVIGKRTRQAHIGDIITCHIREERNRGEGRGSAHRRPDSP